MKSALLTLLLSTSMWQCYRALSVDPVVVSRQGTVRGVRSSDGNYDMFLGIPFATVDPDNPFGVALPGPIFKEIFEAKDDSARCPQREEFNLTIVGSLDCLRVNVYVPSGQRAPRPLPVMVYVHGGYFNVGDSSRYLYGPHLLVRHGVVLVTFNYRLGPYGFMCLDTPSVPGNTGLKDQRAAFRWVKDNIAAFGGDPDSITAFGNSIGAMSIDFHLLSPGSRGSFHRAIMQSGTALTERYLPKSRPSAPFEMAKHLGYEAASLDEALRYIKDVPTDDLVRAGLELGIEFKPCVEKSFAGVENIMVDRPIVTLRSGTYESVPVIMGCNAQEMFGLHTIVMKNEDYVNWSKHFFYDTLKENFFFTSEKELIIATDAVREFYIGSRAVNKDVAFELSTFESDVYFFLPLEILFYFKLAKSRAPMFQYVFGYSGELNYMKILSNITRVPGAFHADEIGYLFKQAYVADEVSPRDQLMIDRMTTMWTNFAKYGEPTPEASELLPVRWPAVSRDSRDYLYIDDELVVKKNLYHDRITFWELFCVAFKDYFDVLNYLCENDLKLNTIN